MEKGKVDRARFANLPRVAVVPYQTGNRAPALRETLHVPYAFQNGRPKRNGPGSAKMIVTELVRHFQKAPHVLDTRFQFDVMMGPQRGYRKWHNRKADCECVSRRKNIELLRGRRP
jgi:hypothetical protein